MTQEIEIPLGLADNCNVRKINKLIVRKTGREAYVELNERANSVSVFPESPTHADNIIHMLESMNLEYYHE